MAAVTKKSAIVCPFLGALAPIIFLASHNFKQIDLSEFLLPAIVSISSSGFLLMAFLLIRKDYLRNSIIVSILITSFLSYGHLFEFLWGFDLFRSRSDLHWVLSIYLVLTILAISAAVWMTSRDLKLFHSFLTATFTVMILISIMTIAGELRTPPGNGAGMATYPIRQNSILKDSESLPDIYYIILDSYSRADALKKLYGYDNSDFIAYLKDSDFYVADRSWSNYPRTYYSLASSLNMQYLDSPHSTGKEMLRAPIVASFLQSKGYRYVHFETYSFESKESDIADISYGYTPFLGKEFIRTFLRSTALIGFERHLPQRYVAQGTLYRFQKLRDIPKIKGPTFTFAHFLPPHRPFIFDRNGNFLERDGGDIPPYSEIGSNMYIEQLVFMNGKIRSLIDYLKKESPVRPIIIIQGDHGGLNAHIAKNTVDSEHLSILKMWDNLAILNAYYVPADCRGDLYPTITPVNTFRLLFKNLFGEDLKKLPDISYGEVRGEEFIRSDVPNDTF